jgi:hypothetical protein
VTLARLSERQQRDGVNDGDGATVGESHRDIRGGNFRREFSDGEYIERAKCEVAGAQITTEFLDGSAYGGELIFGIVKQTTASVGCVADLMAVVRHFYRFLGAGLCCIAKLTMRSCDLDVKAKVKGTKNWGEAVLRDS